MATKKISELILLDTVDANLQLTIIPVLDTSSGTTKKVTLQQINDSIEANIPFAAAAFTQANTPSHVANSSSTYANAAFSRANTANTNAATADQKAVSSGVYANAAFAVANSGITDSWARDSVNASSSYANSGFSKANTANTLAQAAYDYANTIVVIDSWARDSVNSSSSYGNSAFAVANTANTYTAANSQIWDTSTPTTIQAAIDRLANVIYTLNSNSPIP